MKYTLLIHQGTTPLPGSEQRLLERRSGELGTAGRPAGSDLKRIPEPPFVSVGCRSALDHVMNLGNRGRTRIDAEPGHDRNEGRPEGIERGL
jgi:hypothetical protein